jgi:hypothetical protein
MDLETALLLGVPVVLSIAIGIQHFYDRFAPKGLYVRSGALARELPTRIGSEVKDALTGLETRLDAFTRSGDGGQVPSALVASFDGIKGTLAALPSAIGLEVGRGIETLLTKAATVAEAVPIVPPEVTGAMGAVVKNEKAMVRDLNRLVGQAALGPYGKILTMFDETRPLYDYLTEHPEAVETALKMPIVQKVINWASKNIGGLPEDVRQAASLVAQAAPSWWGP